MKMINMVFLAMYVSKFCFVSALISQEISDHVGWLWGSWSPWNACGLKSSFVVRSRGCTKMLSEKCWALQVERRICIYSEETTLRDSVGISGQEQHADFNKTIGLKVPSEATQALGPGSNVSTKNAIPVSSQLKPIEHIASLCPFGYGYFLVNGRGTKNGEDRASCYKITAERKAWIDARAECQSSGGDLISIETPAEQNHARNIIQREGDTLRALWTSGSDSAAEGTWRWESTGKLIVYSSWIPGQPDNAFFNQDYLTINTLMGGDWQDSNENVYAFQGICERDA